MKLLRGNLFTQVADAICVTTNGAVKTNGDAVTGRGCALEATRLWPALPRLLGQHLQRAGNHVTVLLPGPPAVVSFPVKPACAIFDGRNAIRHMASHYTIGSRIPGWACTADPALIERSALELVDLANDKQWSAVVLPRPGCGAGELAWHDIAPLLQRILDDRFVSVSF